MFTRRGKTMSLSELSKKVHPWSPSGVRDLRSLAAVEGVFAQCQAGRKPGKTVLLEGTISLLWEMVGTLLPLEDPKMEEGQGVAVIDLVGDQNDQPTPSSSGTKVETIPPEKSELSAVMKSRVHQVPDGGPAGQEWEVIPWKPTDLQTELAGWIKDAKETWDMWANRVVSQELDKFFTPRESAAVIAKIFPG